ncbi:MAG: ATP-binding protein [Promethearchaeota archaeon]|nr:MAG: ATP-binding protein [Candidatus Lokiarchaeota archaeon]
MIGSPSSTAELTIDIIGTAVDKSLVGKLGVFKYMQDAEETYALGQITEIEMRNVWAQDPTMRGIIRQKGRVDPITERQDIHIAKMMVSSVFANSNRHLVPSFLGTIPATGTSIKMFDENILNELLMDYQEELYYLGKAYGSNIKLPMWFKHFGNEKEGVGEAYHIGIFGKTGSGKSVLAKMIVSAYARHKNMSIFVLDPQGEFSQEFSSNEKLRKIIENQIGRKIKIYTLQNLVFDFSETLFMDLLIASGFFNKLKITFEDHWPRFVDEAIKALNYETEHYKAFKPWEYYEEEAFKLVWNLIPDEDFLSGIIFTKAPRERVKATWYSLNKKRMYKLWAGVTNLFRYKDNSDNVRLTKLFEKTSEGNPLVIIDLSTRKKPENLIWNDDIQLVAIQQFLSKITHQAENMYKKGGNLNSLVVIDEAHRLAPRGKIENENIARIRRIFIDAIRTTRKFGLGWMFISQTLSSIDKEILNQIRISIFGFGLGWGTELRSLKEIIGGAREAIRLYQNFKDPQSGLGKREYPFMTIGPISPLSFSGTPLFFNALEYPDEFIDANFK